MPGYVLHHEVAGELGAPELVMVGSLGTTTDMWSAQADALASRLQVVRLDVRGHGHSPVPPGPYSIAELGLDVLATLDHLGLERVHYCGLSIGGMIGMWLAANAPERIDRLVVMCTSSDLGSAGYAERAAHVREAQTVEVVADAVIARWFTPAWIAAHPRQATGWRDTLVATPFEGYAACCEAIDAMDLGADLARIAAPVLVIAAADDLATPPAHGQAIAQAIPDARLTVLNDAAHLAAVEQPEAVTRLIAGHLLGAAE